MTISGSGNALFCTVVLSISVSASAAELQYTPVNPNFGGSPLNGSFLLNEAAANNYRYLTNKSENQQASSQTASQEVIQNLQQAAVNAVLSQVAQQISSGLQNNQSGSYNVAGELIDFQRVDSEININITDATTGAITTLQIPVPTF